MKHVHTIPIANEGMNVVLVPVDGETLAVHVGPGFAPALAILAEHDAKMEERSFFVSRSGNLYVEGELTYIGTAQEDQRAALHVFEVEPPAAKAVKGAKP